MIAVSEATRRDLLRYYPIEASRIAVVSHGVDEPIFELASRRDPQPYVLCVSTLHPHKNIERLLRVFARFRQRRPEWSLVLAGMRGFHAAAIERQVAALGLGGAVRIPGWIPREDLHELYRRAGVFIYPSTFEGFGMPVLEALAAGLPTACSDIDPLREIAAGAAVRFPPHNEDAMLAALERLLTHPPEGGPAQARRFSWEASARSTLSAIEDVKAGPWPPHRR
jgi:glycosyltransferase involved in cell wall biosynthesis